MFDAMQLAQKYCDEVANPMDMILFRKESTSSKRSKSSMHSINDDPDEMAQIFQYEDDVDWNKTVQGGIKKHFSLEENKDKITVLSVNGLNEALNRFIERGDTDAFKDIISHQMKKTIAHLETCNVSNTESILNEIKNLRDQRMEKEQEEEVEIQQFFNDPNKNKKSCKDTVDVIDSDEDDEQTIMTKGRGARGRGAPSRGRATRGGGRGKNKNTPDVTITSISSGKPKDQTSLRAYVRASNKKNIENIVIDDSD